MIDDVAAAVVTQLNAQTWNPTFTAVFDDAPLLELYELETLKVSVVPYGVTIAPTKAMPGQARAHRFRGIEEYQYVLSIGFQQVAPPRPAIGADPVIAMSAELRTLQQTVARFLNNPINRRPAANPTPPPDYPEVWLRNIEHVPLYDVELLRDKRLFVGVLHLTYEEFVRPN